MATIPRKKNCRNPISLIISAEARFATLPVKRSGSTSFPATQKPLSAKREKKGREHRLFPWRTSRVSLRTLRLKAFPGFCGFTGNFDSVTIHPCQELLQLPWQVPGKRQLFSGPRMPQLELRRVQKVSLHRQRSAPSLHLRWCAIHRIPDHRMSDRRQMHANLVRSPRIDLHLEQRELAKRR